MQAYRIVNWWKYEITSKGRLATAKTPMKDIRKTPLVFVRFPIHGHTLSADYRRMVKRAGNDAAACDGVYKALVGLAGNQVREKRGWILDDRQRPLDPKQVAELLCLPENQVQRIYAILMDEEVKWVELVENPKALHNPGKAGVLPGGKRGAVENNGVPLNETETEERNLNRFEANRIEGEGVSGGKKGEGESQVGENAGQPQAPPAAQASVSDLASDPAPVSASEQPTASDSVSVPASDSVSQPGPRAGPGADEMVPLTDKNKIFKIIREGKKAALELSQIIHLRDASDTTTINDIYTQLQQRLIAGSPYPLFELSLNTARQCWRADKPIAMFITAMKKPPFYYVPKKLSVVPGKFSQGRNTK